MDPTLDPNALELDLTFQIIQYKGAEKAVESQQN